MPPFWILLVCVWAVVAVKCIFSSDWLCLTEWKYVGEASRVHHSSREIKWKLSFYESEKSQFAAFSIYDLDDFIKPTMQWFTVIV